MAKWSANSQIMPFISSKVSLQSIKPTIPRMLTTSFSEDARLEIPDTS